MKEQKAHEIMIKQMNEEIERIKGVTPQKIVAKLHEESGLTQEEFGKLVKMNRHNMNAVLRGKKGISAKKLVEIITSCRSFYTNLNELFGIKSESF